MQLEEFLKVCNQFQLGELVTEKPHPATVGLAEAAQNDPYKATGLLHEADLSALDRLQYRLNKLPQLVAAIRRTITNGGRIFIAGCGATGRLALSLETLAREEWLGEDRRDRVIGFMAGGDTALIRSIESFEDYPEYGARQLRELGFQVSDILLAITEGGETPFVIGACLEAAEISREKPWFLFCNPPEILCRVAERSRRVLQTGRVESMCLEVGPMALSGSTRMQATTVQMLVAGAAIMEALDIAGAREQIDRFHEWMKQHEAEALIPLVEAEANIYHEGNLVLYQTDRYGITVLTDTTERSPTFSLPPFENRDRPEDLDSPCYVSINGTENAAQAWLHLLHRRPRSLEWPEVAHRASLEVLMGYDISGRAGDWRQARLPGKKQYPFLVHGTGPLLEFAGYTRNLGLDRESLLLRHLGLKCSLNLHSTLVMGRLGRFQSNLMTYVRPSNHKLVDRAARYRQNKYRQENGRNLDYGTAVREVFASL